MISYQKLFQKMNEQGKAKKDIREQKIVGQETLRKLNSGTGIYEDYDYYTGEKDEEENAIKESKRRITSIDTRSIEALCAWLDCKPEDIMEYIPNKWENADQLCKELSRALKKEILPDQLPNYVKMPPKE